MTPQYINNIIETDKTLQNSCKCLLEIRMQTSDLQEYFVELHRQTVINNVTVNGFVCLYFAALRAMR
mgnify:CR=1 FL=1